MLINQIKVRGLLAKELGRNKVGHERLKSYVNAKVMCISKSGSRGGLNHGLLYCSDEVMNCIPWIMNHEFDEPARLKEQRLAKTQRAKDNMRCKEPKLYADAFSLMNLCMVS